MAPTEAPERDINLTLTTVRKSKKPDAIEIPMSWKALAKKHFFDNKDMNKLKKSSEASRAELLGLMADSDVEAFTFQTKNADSAVVGLTVSIGTPLTDKVDVQKLAELVGLQELLDSGILSVSKAAIENHPSFGKKIAAQVLVPTPGTENVSVKATT